MSNELALASTDDWADILPAVGDLAVKIAGTSFVPKSLRGHPAEVAACVLSGREIGIGPMQSLQKIHVIDGRPSLSSELMRSLVLRAGHEIRYPIVTDAKVTVEGRRHGSESWTAITWTMQDAQRIGVAGKTTWKQYPRQMLSARATSELCRLLFPDALGGITVTPEELEDESAARGVKVSRASVPATNEVDPAPTGPVKVSRKPKPAPEPEPEPVADMETGEIIDAEIVEDALPIEETQAVDKSRHGFISAAQTKMMASLMRELGIVDRQDALDYVVGIIGRGVESRSDLTQTEARQVIDALVADQQAKDAAESLDAAVVDE